PYVLRCSFGVPPRLPTVLVKSTARWPPQKSQAWPGSERVTIKNLLTGYHALDVTSKKLLGGYMAALLAYLAIYVIWGSTYLAIRVAVGSIPPLLLMGVRCTVAGLLLLAWATLRGERSRPHHWRHAAIAGGLMIACTYGALGWAEQRLASGVAALLSATSPLWLTVFEWSRRGRPALTTLAGLLLCVARVGGLVWGGSAGVRTAAP